MALDNVLNSVYAVQEFRLGDTGIGLFCAALGAVWLPATS
ncbi:hypothetical protein J2T18_003764 [Paenibacillus polymyxa]|nr:hypothetical protein [Paenibacillus polymyxa]